MTKKSERETADAYDCLACGATYFLKVKSLRERNFLCDCDHTLVLRTGKDKPDEPVEDDALDMTFTVAEVTSGQEYGLTWYEFFSPSVETQALAMIGVLSVPGHKRYRVALNPANWDVCLDGDTMRILEKIDYFAERSNIPK